MRYRLPGRPWFKVHRNGFGASPKTWEGWLFTFCYLGGIAVLSHGAGLLTPEAVPAFVPFFWGALLLTFVFVVFAWLKTDDRWKWRWDGEVKDTMKIDADPRDRDRRR